MTHSKIQRFKIDGILAGDCNMIAEREKFEERLTIQMREKGCVPILDVRPAWGTEWGGKSYAFWLTMHGIYVGKEQAWTIEAIADGKAIPRISPAKSKEQLKPVE